jgi:ABC-type bacteriocin/lantibiotic exporter with double-glycine peptidase domain
VDWLQTVYNVSQSSMTAIVLIIMLVAGGRAVASHDMTMGSLMSFYFCLALLSSYLRDQLGSVTQIIADNESLLEL